MMSLEAFIARHGEPAAQAILENWERYMNMRPGLLVSLDQRWNAFMCDTTAAQAA